MLENIVLIDTKIMLAVEGIRNPVLSSLFIPVTLLGNAGIIFIITGIVMLFFKKTKQAGLLILLSLLISFILNEGIIKNIIKRDRPFLNIENFSILVKPLYTYSFPSGHTACAFASMVTLFYTFKKVAPFGLFFAILMAFSRVYVGVHYPSDVIAGAIIGTICAILISKIYIKTYKKGRLV